MALPKQQLPIFSTTIPSTQQKIKFRGFTVKEEKSLLLAQESEDPDVIINAVNEILSACIQDKIDVLKLATFDVEYLMTHIRAKSVGETVKLRMPCDVDENHKRTLIEIDISQIKVKIPENHHKVIKLYDDVGVTMKYPTMQTIVDVENATGVDVIVMCLENIFTDEEVFPASEQTREEIMDFLDGLTKSQIEKIEKEFFETMPSFEFEFEYKCQECGTEHKKIIRGLNNFFT